jgi:hypothetical protein
MSGAHQNLDLERLARIIAMGGSGHSGEALAALRLADHSIRAAGMTWHDVLLPGRLIEGLVAEGERLRDELTALRTAKAVETQQLRDALAAVRRRRRPIRQRGLVGALILCCLSVPVLAMYMIGDVISDCVGGPVPVVNSPADSAGIAPPPRPRRRAAFKDCQTSQDCRRTVFGVIATARYPVAQLRPLLGPLPIRPEVSGDHSRARNFCRTLEELSGTPMTGTELSGHWT